MKKKQKNYEQTRTEPRHEQNQKKHHQHHQQEQKQKQEGPKTDTRKRQMDDAEGGTSWCGWELREPLSPAGTMHQRPAFYGRDFGGVSICQTMPKETRERDPHAAVEARKKGKDLCDPWVIGDWKMGLSMLLRAFGGTDRGGWWSKEEGRKKYREKGETILRRGRKIKGDG